MTASLDPTFQPPSDAIIAWLKDGSIYVMLPSKDLKLPPYIVSYPLTENGLWQAVNILKKHEVQTPTPSIIESRPVDKVPRSRKPVDISKRGYTEEQKARALDLLKKKGILG